MDLCGYQCHEISITAASFFGINNEGLSSAIQTSGNRNVHLVLRGGNGPNYDAIYTQAAKSLASEEL